jgi:hypothetical protein
MMSRTVDRTLVIAALVGLATGNECDVYSFCSEPGMTIVDEKFEYGQTFQGHT